nr:Inositol 2-dehydrogenase/D-chiro-inositol 3-dehydrogenase [uncultured bacterium]
MRLLVLGTGRMATLQTERGWSHIDGVEIVAGCDIVPENLAAYCDAFGVPNRFSSLDEALAWGQFDAVTNVTPDAVHHPTTMALLAAGLPVFCEKPLATDYALAMEMTEAAERVGVVNMVNLTYRNVAELHTVRQLVTSGAIGEVKHIEASYLQSWLALRSWIDPNIAGRWLWRMSTAHGSNGSLGDIGIHTLDLVTYGAALDVKSLNCRLQTFNKVPGNRIGEYVLDANDSFIISAEFSNGAIGVIHASRWAGGHSNDQKLRIYGDKGGIELNHGHWGTTLRVCLGDDLATWTWRELTAEPVATNYHRFAAAVVAGRTDNDPDFRRAAALQQVLDLALTAGADRREHQL